MNRPIDFDLLDLVLVSLVLLFLIVVAFLSALKYYRRKEQKKE